MELQFTDQQKKHTRASVKLLIETAKRTNLEKLNELIAEETEAGTNTDNLKSVYAFCEALQTRQD